MVRPLLAIYEATSILKALELFKLAPVHMAAVVDEYGSLEGVVTQTDLLEAIAGDLPDGVQKEPEIVKREDGSFLLDAAISIEEAKEALGLENIPIGDYQTLTGLALVQTGEVPKVKDRFEFGGWRFEIVKMEGARISKLSATRVPASDKIRAP